MKFFNRISLLALVAFVIVSAGCSKSKPYDVTIPASQVHFDGAEDQAYAVRSAAVGPYEIEVGTTDVISTDRTVTFNIISTTGAVAGTQYSVPGGNTVTIPAGKATGVIFIQGIFSGYPVGRVDTLIIALTEPSVKPAEFSDTIKLAIGDICVEGVGFDIIDFEGAYANTNEDFGGPYGPYTTTISSVTSTGPTSATIVVTNIFDDGWDPLTFDLEWSDPAGLTAIIVPEPAVGGSDAGSINPAYAGQTVAIRAHPTGGVGTFSSCNNTLTLRMQLGVTGLGYFAPVYTVVMER